MNKSSVLIIADHPDFARDIVAHWQVERNVPIFTVLSSEFWSAPGRGRGDLVVVGATQLPERKLAALLRDLDATETPTICVFDSVTIAEVLRREFPRVCPVRHTENWLEVLVTLANEILRRSESTAKLRHADQLAQGYVGQAALGNYMQQTRHGFNNALTSVLGNAELLMLESERMSEGMREQVSIIHSMALRLHEMMQRFASLEAEMMTGNGETPPGVRRSEAYAQGS